MRYEPSIRVFTVFFSALLAIGLKHLLGEWPTPFGFGPDRWPSFILALLLFLRFLTGTANHLGFEFSGEATTKKFLARHAVSLMIFAVLALRICYSHTLGDFLKWIVIFCAVAAFFNLLDMATNTRIRLVKIALDRVGFATPKGDWLPVWLFQNLAQLAVTGVALYFDFHHWWECPVPVVGFKTSMTILILAFGAICWWDFNHQLKVLKNV